GNCQIEFAIAVEITHCYSIRLCSWAHCSGKIHLSKQNRATLFRNWEDNRVGRGVPGVGRRDDCGARPSSCARGSRGTTLLPCWVQTPPILVNTHIAPLTLSPGRGDRRRPPNRLTACRASGPRF